MVDSVQRGLSVLKYPIKTAALWPPHRAVRRRAQRGGGTGQCAEALQVARVRSGPAPDALCLQGAAAASPTELRRLNGASGA